MEVYCDNAATTKPYHEVVEVVARCMEEMYGNPSSEHRDGMKATDKLRKARRNIASHIGAHESEIYFTSGASESNNWAIQGIMGQQKKIGKPFIITSEFEHHSILNLVDALACDGVSPLYVRPDNKGYIDPHDIEALLDKHEDRVGLVSIMLVNNEIGTIQPISLIADICHAHDVLLHVDATQAIGHIEVDVKSYGMDMMSFSGHKFHGPRGIGCLYVKEGVKLSNLIYGGKQERGHRAGTENLPGIVGMSTALDIAYSDYRNKEKKLYDIRDWIVGEMFDICGVRLNGSLDCHAPGILNFTFIGVEGESLLLMLDTYGISASAGSACATGSIEPSHVLKAIGCTKEQAMCSIRLSFDETTIDMEKAKYLVETVRKCVTTLRDASDM